MNAALSNLDVLNYLALSQIIFPDQWGILPISHILENQLLLLPEGTIKLILFSIIMTPAPYLLYKSALRIEANASTGSKRKKGLPSS